MKKLIALAALAACLPSFAGTVESSNTVGYTKVHLDAGYNMIGVSFSEIGGDAQSLSTCLKMDETYAGYNNKYKFANTLRVWNGNGYDTYGWAGTSGTDIDDDPTLDNTWTDLGAEAVDGETLPVGSGVWISAEDQGEVVVLGEVPSGNVTINLMSGYNIVANPFPMDCPISTFGKMDASYSGYNNKYKFANTMRVWNGNGYDTYGWAATSGTDVDDDPTLDNTWTDLGAEAVSGTIPCGTAVWIYAEKAGTITFTAP